MHGLLRSSAVPPGLSMREYGAVESASHYLVGSASCSLACPIPQSTTSPGLPATTLPRVLSAWLPVFASPTGPDECFFFIYLVVRLPYSLIFCQFWLFFVFKLLLSFFCCARRHSESTYASILAGSPKSSRLLISFSNWSPFCP